MTVNVSRCVCGILKRPCSGLFHDDVCFHFMCSCCSEYNVEHSLFEENTFQACKCRWAKIVG